MISCLQDLNFKTIYLTCSYDFGDSTMYSQPIWRRCIDKLRYILVMVNSSEFCGRTIEEVFAHINFKLLHMALAAHHSLHFVQSFNL